MHHNIGWKDALLAVISLLFICVLVYIQYFPINSLKTEESHVIVINPHVIPYCYNSKCSEAIEFTGIQGNSAQTYVDDLDGYTSEDALKYIYREGYTICINHHDTLVVSICS